MLELPDITHLTTPEHVEAWIDEIYGQPLTATGVIHVTSVWRRDPSTHVTLAINEQAPSSDFDHFALMVGRARADAILATGSILRAEPELRHEVGGPGAEAIQAWRRQVAGKDGPPISVIMTSSGDIDLDHPLFSRHGRTVIYTSRDGGWQLESRAADRGIELIMVDSPTPRAAIDTLRQEFGAATILVEAGPSVASRLYEPEPPVVDELMLTVLESSSLAEVARAGTNVAPRLIDRWFDSDEPSFRRTNNDGDWRLQRYIRRLQAHA